MSGRRPGSAQIIKYLLLLLIIVYTAALMFFVSGSSRSFDDVETDMRQTLASSGMTERGGQTFRQCFGLNSADYAGVMYYSAESAMSAEEVFVIRVNSTDQIEEVLDAVEARLSQRIREYEDYLPEQKTLLEEAQQSVRGRYIFYAVSAEADKYRAAFEDAL